MTSSFLRVYVPTPLGFHCPSISSEKVRKLSLPPLSLSLCLPLYDLSPQPAGNVLAPPSMAPARSPCRGAKCPRVRCNCTANMSSFSARQQWPPAASTPRVQPTPPSSPRHVALALTYSPPFISFVLSSASSHPSLFLSTFYGVGEKGKKVERPKWRDIA